MVENNRLRCRTFYYCFLSVNKGFDLNNKLWHLHMPPLTDLKKEVPCNDAVNNQTLDNQRHGLCWHKFLESVKETQSDAGAFYRKIIDFGEDGCRCIHVMSKSYLLAILCCCILLLLAYMMYLLCIVLCIAMKKEYYVFE